MKQQQQQKIPTNMYICSTYISWLILHLCALSSMFWGKWNKIYIISNQKIKKKLEKKVKIIKDISISFNENLYYMNGVQNCFISGGRIKGSKWKSRKHLILVKNWYFQFWLFSYNRNCYINNFDYKKTKLMGRFTGFVHKK